MKVNGTELFDGVIDRVAEYLTTKKLKIVASEIANEFASRGWDTQHESRWYNYLFVYLVEIDK